MLAHVLVAYDGSEGSRHALQFARKMIAATEAKITLVQAVELPVPVVIGPFDGYVTLGDMPTREQLEEAEKKLHALLADLPPARCGARVELGTPADVVVRVAEELSPDVVVVGARGLSVAGRWLLGSVSDRVVHHCPCPVTVVL